MLALNTERAIFRRENDGLQVGEGGGEGPGEMEGVRLEDYVSARKMRLMIKSTCIRTCGAAKGACTLGLTSRDLLSVMSTPLHSRCSLRYSVYTK